jgi:hypothetical protein
VPPPHDSTQTDTTKAKKAGGPKPKGTR